MIKTIESLESLDMERETWMTIEKNPSMLIFQTFDWCRTAWVHVVSQDSRNKLWVLKWTQDGRDDVVYFPFYIDSRGVLRFIFDTDSDACNSVYLAKEVNRYWCYREVADAIIAASNIQGVWLQKMRCGSEILDYLGVFLPGALVYKDNAYAYMHMLPGGDITLSQTHMRSSDRKHWRQLLRKSEKYQFDVLSAANGNDFPEADIRRIANEMVAARYRANGFLSEGVMCFIKNLYSNGLCEIPVLKEADRIITVEFRLLKGNYVLDWIFLSSCPSTGTEINVKYCTEKAKEYAGVMDFGVGAYEYKILTTRPQVGVTFSLRYSKSKFGYLRNLISLNVRCGKDWVKSWRKKV